MRFFFKCDLSGGFLVDFAQKTNVLIIRWFRHIEIDGSSSVQSQEVILELSASFKPDALVKGAAGLLSELDGCLNTNMKMLSYNVNKVSNWIFRELKNKFDSLVLN